MARRFCLVAFTIVLATASHALDRKDRRADSKKCPIERAVYHSAYISPGNRPDELTVLFNSQPKSIFPRIRVHSHELRREYIFDTYVTQGSGEEGIALQIESKLDGAKITMKSVGLGIDYDLSMEGVVFVAGNPSPPTIIFPEFWRFNGVMYRSDISVGLAGFVFDFKLCAPKRHD